MTELGVFLGGEGPNELGSYAGHPAYYDEHKPGVIVTLLRKLQATGFRIVGGKKWTEIRKYQAKGPSPNETRNVEALCLDAKEAGAQVLAFIRDSDGDEERVRDIESAVAEHEAKGEVPALIPGIADPLLEGWLLALGGERCTEQLSKARAASRCQEKHQFGKNTEQVVAFVEGCDLERVPADAARLNRWLDRAKSLLGTRKAQTKAED